LLLNPEELGYPAPEVSVLARKASLAHEAFTIPLDSGWLGRPTSMPLALSQLMLG
jgi:hypothetical protein